MQPFQNLSHLVILAIPMLCNIGLAANPTETQAHHYARIERDLDVMTRVFYRLNSSIATLSHYANIFWPESSAEQYHIRQYSDGLVRELQFGTELIRNDVRDITLSDVSVLRSMVADLRDSCSELTVCLLARTAEFERGGMCDEVRDRMEAVKEQADVFIGEIMVRVSEEATWHVKAMAAAVIAPLNEVEGAYAVGSCVDDGQRWTSQVKAD